MINRGAVQAGDEVTYHLPAGRHEYRSAVAYAVSMACCIFTERGSIAPIPWEDVTQHHPKHGDRIVIVGCGARKRPQPGRAADVYTGPYFRACLAAAQALAPPGRVFILSAKYGLLLPGSRIVPYDLTLGQPGAADAAKVHMQAFTRRIHMCPVTALCGARYTALIREAWAMVAAPPDVTAPLAGLGIGQQRAVLARMVENRARGST